MLLIFIYSYLIIVASTYSLIFVIKNVCYIFGIYVNIVSIDVSHILI